MSWRPAPPSARCSSGTSTSPEHTGNRTARARHTRDRSRPGYLRASGPRRSLSRPDVFRLLQRHRGDDEKEEAMTAVIQARGLGKRNRNRWALADCTLSIPAGHIAGLVGPTPAAADP